VAIVIAVLLVGCGGGQDEAPAPAKEVAKAPPAKKPAPPPKAPAEADNKGVKKAVQEASSINVTKSKEVLDKVGFSFTYDPVNKPDPFKPYKAGIMADDQEDNPLLRYEVRYFRLVGISIDEAEPMAMFEDPAGRAYILHIGDRIGRGGGIVQSITKDTVIVTETRISPRFEAGTETVQIPIRLHPEEYVLKPQ
jgi:Tfp pilus assembly protein PilP